MFAALLYYDWFRTLVLIMASSGKFTSIHHCSFPLPAVYDTPSEAYRSSYFEAWLNNLEIFVLIIKSSKCGGDRSMYEHLMYRSLHTSAYLRGNKVDHCTSYDQLNSRVPECLLKHSLPWDCLLVLSVYICIDVAWYAQRGSISVNAEVTFTRSRIQQQ